MRTVRLVVLGAAAWLLFLLVQMPASYAVARATLPPGLVLDDVNGTLWKGDAHATLHNGGAALAIDRLAWTFRPLRLFAGKLAFDVEAHSPQLEARGRVEHGFGGLSASDVSARADASIAPALFPLAAAWQPRGTVTLDAPRLAWNDDEIAGNARAEWKDAAASMPQPRALGSYRADLEGRGGPAKLAITTVAGDYPVRGSGTLTPRRVELRGQAGGQDFAIVLP